MISPCRIFGVPAPSGPVVLLFTRQGQVRVSLPERLPQEAAVLLDLNDRQPAPQPSPAWARRRPPGS